MRRRRAFIIICLFGVAGAILLSLSRSQSLAFISISKSSLTDEYTNWPQQLIHLMSYKNLKMRVSDIFESNIALERKENESRCPNILSGVVKGKWVKRTLTQQEQVTIDEYLRKERGVYQIPPSYQRNDGRCGDVAYEKSPIVWHLMFKAICDPKGDTPCCQTNKCINATEADCRCPTCYDERQSIHAEYAQWKTEDDLCEVKNFTALEACTVLNGTTLHFVGDSFIRHVFAAMVIILTNNPEGAVKESTPKYYRDQCKGMHQITGFPCRDYIDDNRSVCNDTVKVVYTEVFHAKDFSRAVPFLQTLTHVNKSMAVLGLGIHDNFNVKTVSEKFLLPLFSLHQAHDMQGNQQISEPNNLKTSTIYRTNLEVSNSRERKNYTDVGRLTNLQYPVNLDFLRSHNVKVDNLQTSNVSRVRRNSETGNSSPPIISQTSQSSADKMSWPRLLWIGTHSPGLLKSPTYSEQTAAGVQSFNKNIYEILNDFKVPYLDTFEFTKGIVSFDGTHYGWGINMLKANMLLTYIQQERLRDPGWRDGYSA